MRYHQASRQRRSGSSHLSYNLDRDLDEILDVAADDLRHFSDTRIYVTGGTGFFGTWLLRTIARANRRLDTRICLDVLTRDAAQFESRAPDIARNPNIRLRTGNILSSTYDGTYDGVIHAATPAVAVASTPAEDMFKYVVDGTRSLIEGVLSTSPNAPILFTSSGAVYGRQPADITHIAETHTNGPDQLDPSQAYHEGKRAAELLLASAAHRSVGKFKLARLFAFLGPGLPLNAHYAAGNFIGDAIAGRPIRIAGDGTPIRSYLYPTDMIAWCLAIFARGENSRAYNVGSQDAVSLIEVAQKIDRHSRSGLDVTKSRTSGENAPNRYVPSTRRIEAELSVRRTVELDEAIRRTMESYRI